MPFPPEVDLPNPEIEPGSLALQADSLPSEALGKLLKHPCDPEMNLSWSWNMILICILAYLSAFLSDCDFPFPITSCLFSI